MTKQDRKKLQRGHAAADGGDSETPGSSLDTNEGDELAAEVVWTNSGTRGYENDNPNAEAKESFVSEARDLPDEAESGRGPENDEPSVFESGAIRNINRLTEPNMSSPVLSEDKENSTSDAEKISKNIPLSIAHEYSGKIPESTSKTMNDNSKTMNTGSKLVYKTGEPSTIAEEGDDPGNNPEFQDMNIRLRVFEEGKAMPHNLTSESGTSASQGDETEISVVEPYESNSFANGVPVVIGNSGVARESLSDINSQLMTHKNVIKDTTGLEWRNGEYSTAALLHNINANAKQITPYDSNELTELGDGTAGEIDPFWSTLDQNESAEEDGSPRNTFSVSLYSRAASEDDTQTSLDKSINVMEPRHYHRGHGVPYYVNTPAASAYVRPRWDEMPPICVVPCSPVDYIVDPYRYGYYGAPADHSYATGVHVPPVHVSPVHVPPVHVTPLHIPPLNVPPLQVPPLHVPHVNLPPKRFPDLQDSSSAFSSTSVDGHEDHASTSESGHDHNYVVTSNAYAGTSEGSQNYGSASHSYVKGPLSHLEYSLATPQEYVQTSLVLKAPHPYQHVHPSFHHDEKENIDIHRSAYF
jgi:hypothetical protein